MRISNLTATGSWQQLVDVIPHRAYEVIIQARTSVDVQLANTSDVSKFVTIKAGASMSFQEVVSPGDYSLLAPAGVVVEIISFTRMLNR